MSENTKNGGDPAQELEILAHDDTGAVHVPDDTPTQPPQAPMPEQEIPASDSIINIDVVKAEFSLVMSRDFGTKFGPQPDGKLHTFRDPETEEFNQDGWYFFDNTGAAAVYGTDLQEDELHWYSAQFNDLPETQQEDINQRLRNAQSEKVPGSKPLQIPDGPTTQSAQASMPEKVQLSADTNSAALSALKPDVSNDSYVTTTAGGFDFHNPKPLARTTFPNTQVNPGDNSRLPATIPNLEHMLDSYGIPVRYNVMDKDIQINIPGMTGCPDNADNAAITHIHSLAALNGLPTGPIHAYLEAIADKHQFNPVMEYILSKPWDGIKRINELADTLVTGPDFPEKLKRTLVRKWLVSAVAAAAMPTGFRSRGVLSLQGAQGLGKTSWILKLVDNPLLQSQAIKIDHHLDPGNKDSVLTATSHWLVEIGEVDSSFKKDIARLKGFITADQDKVRRPYGRKDSVYPRRTVFVATVNHANFLVDDTGNSRWWAIPVVRIDYKHEINMQQVWAQVYQLYLKDHEWWLTPEEEVELEKHNAKHRSVNSIRDLVYSALDLTVPEADRKALSATQLLDILGIKNPNNTQCRDCGAALRELLGEPKVSQGLNRWLVPLASNGTFPGL